MTNNTATHTEGNLYSRCIFSIESITAFLHSGTLDSTLALLWGTILNSNITHTHTHKTQNTEMEKVDYIGAK